MCTAHSYLAISYVGLCICIPLQEDKITGTERVDNAIVESSSSDGHSGIHIRSTYV